MKEEIMMVIIFVLSGAAMIVWFCKTVPQGSISFTFKPLGFHFKVEKGILAGGRKERNS
jgi:hypothetical protein